MGILQTIKILNEDGSYSNIELPPFPELNNITLDENISNLANKYECSDLLDILTLALASKQIDHPGSIDITSLELNFDNKSNKVIINNAVGYGDYSLFVEDTSICSIVNKNPSDFTVEAIKNGETLIKISWAETETSFEKEIILPVIVTDMPDTVLNNNNVSLIKKVSDEGLGANYWNIGDSIKIILNGTVGLRIFNNEEYSAFIIGFNHNPSKELSNSIHFQFGLNSDGMNIGFVDENYSLESGKNNTDGFIMNPEGVNLGGWTRSYIQRTICPAFALCLPKEWQNSISICPKYTDNRTIGTDYNNPNNVTKSENKIWILAEYEIFGGSYYANQYEQNYQDQYEYYKNGNSKVKYKATNPNEGCCYWMRSPSASSQYFFRTIDADGGPAANNYNCSLGFVPCFAIGK